MRSEVVYHSYFSVESYEMSSNKRGLLVERGGGAF